MVRLWGVELDDPAQHTPRRLGRRYAAALQGPEAKSRPILRALVAGTAMWLAVIGTVAILSGIGRLLYVSLGA